VIGTDFEPENVYLHARYSRALHKFYRLRMYNPLYGTALYLRDLLNVADKENADLYINCSNLINPSEYAEISSAMETKSSCKTISLDAELINSFSSRDKSLNYIKSLGLPVPELHQVRSRADVHKILHESQGKKRYMLNAPAVNGTVARNPKTMLPRRTLSQTYNDLSRIRISKEEQWTMEQYFAVGEDYTTFAVFVSGELKAFAAAQLAKNSTAYRNIRVDKGIGKAMLNFVRTFGQKAGKDFSSNLSMSFKIDEKNTESGIEWTVLPVDCKVNVSPPMLLFAGTSGSVALVRAYLTILPPTTNGLSTFTGVGALPDSMDHVIAPEAGSGTYFVGEDLLELFLRPIAQMLALKMNVLQLTWNFLTFIEHLLFWRDGIYESWDPLPAFLLYHVYMPVRLGLHFLKRHDSENLDVGLME
jgi:catechol O-methyltransferase